MIDRFNRFIINGGYVLTILGFILSCAFSIAKIDVHDSFMLTIATYCVTKSLEHFSK